MENGVAVNDLSGISPDLNIDTEINNVQSITVYKSSAAVLYGGKAIGGAVDLETDYIPRQLPAKALEFKGYLEGGTNSGQRQGFSAKGKVGKTGHGRLAQTIINRMLYGFRIVQRSPLLRSAAGRV